MPDSPEKPVSGENSGSSPSRIRPAERTSELSTEFPPEPGGAAYPRPYANAQLNSRVSAKLPEGAWEVRWRTELDPVNPYAFLLQAGDRIVLQGSNRWQLFSLKGESLAIENYGDSDVVLDESDGVFYAADPFGRIAARRLDDGSPAYIQPVRGTNDYRRSFLARVDDRFVVTSFRRHSNPHDPEPPRLSVAEVYALNEPQKIEQGILVSSALVAEQEFEAEELLAGLHDETIVLAMQDRFVVADVNLVTQGEYFGDFVPRAMSLDGVGRVYVLVQTVRDEQPRTALWIMASDGHLIADVDVGDMPDNAFRPPVVSYSHRIYLIHGERMLAVDPTGVLAWDEHTGGPVAGAIVTGDDRLVTAAGSLLATWGEDGERILLHALEADRWTTPPVLTEDGVLLIASEQFLYCLSPRE